VVAGARRQRILNCVPSKAPENDWRIEHAAAAGILPSRTPLPRSKDLRADWWKVSNQGSTGSCVGWATVDGALRWHFVKARRIAKSERLAPRFQWMAAKEIDDETARPSTFIEKDGTTIKAALDVARKYGAVKERELPFRGRLYPGHVKSFYALAAQLRINSYINLGVNPDHWRRWLAHKGPVLVRVDHDETFNDPARGGFLDEYLPKPTDEGHAVTLVGYARDRFIIRNSWGVTWGDRGFGYASVDYLTVAITESYGVALTA
jgi:Papain family cysteine protease